MERTNQFSYLPFYIFITLLLGVQGLSGCVSLWKEGNHSLAWAVALLFIGHIGLYWLNLSHPENKRWWLVYHVLQTVMIITLVALVYGSTLSWTAVLGSAIICQIGEALGVWGNSRNALFLGLFYFGLAVLMLAILLDREGFFSTGVNLLVNSGSVVLLMVLFNRQLTEHQKALELSESLECTNAKLATYASKIEMLTLQTERQRMARELHDTLAQGMVGLTLKLEAVKMHLGTGRSERAAVIVEQALTCARNTLAESRAAIDDLRSTFPSLEEALREKADRFTQTTGIPCRVDLTLTADQTNDTIAGHTLYILSEALTNIARHAQATQVLIRCRAQNGLIELEISDNGKGFDVHQELSSGHYGLLGMRERARLTGAELTIESAEQIGTRIYLTAPSIAGGAAG